MAVAIRQVTAQEWRKVRDLRLRALREDQAFFGAPYEHEAAQADSFWIERTASNARGETDVLFVAERGEAFVGLVVGVLDDADAGNAHLYAMWVAPEARGEGVGKGLERAVVDWARGKRCNTMLLEVSSNNPRATKIYEQLGYAFNGKRVDVENRGCGDCLQMSKPIEQAIVVTGYDPEWPGVFEQLRERTWNAVQGIAERIEHVGSTSVPGLAAKPIIDISVVADDSDAVRGCIRALEGIGYAHRGDLGIVGREAFLNPCGLPEHHLYVCIEGGTALRNHLALRDYLRSHPKDARAYGELKLRLAREHAHDIDSYIAGKTRMITSILERAGIAREDLDTIRAQNGEV